MRLPEPEVRLVGWSKIVVVCCLIITVFAWSVPVFGGGARANSSEGAVYVLPVEGTINAQMASFVRRGLARAESEGAAAVVLQVSTLGGTVDAALTIRDALLETSLPTIALVKRRAWSGGALVVLACEYLFMSEGSSIGAAEPRPAEEKIISAWRAEMESTAESRQRDARIAAAMVDERVQIPDLTESGQLLTLTAEKAVQENLADEKLEQLSEAAVAAGLTPTEIVEIKPGGIDRFAGLATDPLWAGLLLFVGFMGIMIELFMPGFGVAGLLGILGFAGYFLAHVAVGHAGLAIVALFVMGVLLMAVEIFIPGFGVVGAGGLVAIFSSIYLAAPGPEAAVRSILMAFGALVVGVFVLIRFGQGLPMWRKLALSAEETPDKGYIATEDARRFEGKRGVVQTALRPSGTAIIDGERVDVVSEGPFVSRGSEVEVIDVEGRRITVREVVAED